MADQDGAQEPGGRRGLTRRQALIGGGAVAVGGGVAAGIVIATSADGFLRRGAG
jgi:hypothetical protein